MNAASAPADPTIELDGSRMAHNTVLNLAGQAIPLLVALGSMPLVTRGLGAERFGLLGIAWVVLGYASVFDLGLGRATTRFVAEALGAGQPERVPRVVWTSVLVQCGFSLVGAVLTLAVTPLLVTRVLRTPDHLLADSLSSLQTIALALPAVMVSGSLRGTLEALQRFDVVNAIRLPSSSANYLAPLLGVLLGWGMPAIMALLVVARWLSALAWGAAVLRCHPGLRSMPAIDRKELQRLASFGGWVMVANTIAPLLNYLDRFLIGAWQSLAAVGYYTAPVETVNRTHIVPSSVVQTLFPTISAIASDRDRLARVYAKATKFMLVIMGLLVLILVALSVEVLTILSGTDFAVHGAPAFRWLCIGALANSVAWVTYTLLDGIGRPDVMSKLVVVELPIYLLFAWWLIPRFGVSGAGLAAAFRLVLDMLLVGLVALRSGHLDPGIWRHERIPVAAVSLIVSLALVTAATELGLGTPVVGSVGIAAATAYGLVAWMVAFSAEDRRVLLRLLDRYRPAAAK